MANFEQVNADWAITFLLSFLWTGTTLLFFTSQEIHQSFKAVSKPFVELSKQWTLFGLRFFNN